VHKKLTLSIDEELIKFAHDFSKKTKKSISSLIEQYLKKLKNQTQTHDLSERTSNLYGIFNHHPIPSKKELREYFHEENHS